MKIIAGTPGEVKRDTAPRLAGRSGASADAPAAGLELLATAERLRAAGLSPLPAWPDTKRPALASWKPYKSRPATLAELRSWRWSSHIGTATGDAAGGLEPLDIDNKGNPGAGEILARMQAEVERRAPGLWTRLTIQATQSGGFHLLYRCATINGNRKLATRPATPAERAANPKRERVGLVETRGRGGFLMLAPSPGYTIIQGSIETIPTITPAERAILLDVAQGFDQQPAEAPRAMPSARQHTPAAPAARSCRPRDAIAEINNRLDARAELQRYGAQYVRTCTSGESWRCFCPNHTSGDKTPSLLVRTATSARKGAWVVMGFTPGCWFYTEGHETWSAFDVVRLGESLTPAETVKRLAGGPERPAPAPAPEQPKHPGGRPPSRHLSAEQTRALMAAHPGASVDQLAELQGVSRRTIYRNQAWLESCAKNSDPAETAGAAIAEPEAAAVTKTAPVIDMRAGIDCDQSGGTPAPRPALDVLARDCFDAYGAPGLRLFRRYIADNGGDDYDPAAVKQFWQREQRRRQRADYQAELQSATLAQLRRKRTSVRSKITRFTAEGKPTAWFAWRERLIDAELARRETPAARKLLQPVDVEASQPAVTTGSQSNPGMGHLFEPVAASGCEAQSAAGQPAAMEALQLAQAGNYGKAYAALARVPIEERAAVQRQINDLLTEQAQRARAA